MKNLFTWVIGFACCVSSVQAQQAPYKNPLVPTEMRVNDLLQRMTLKEKIAQIRHLHSWDVFEGQQLNPDRLAQICAAGGFSGVCRVWRARCAGNSGARGTSAGVLLTE